MKPKIIIGIIIFFVGIITVALFFGCKKQGMNMVNELTDQQMSVGSPWDIVVLGRIDVSWVSQFGPPPHVSYTQVLAGEVPSGQAAGQLALVEVAEELFPESGIPIYKSQKEEICFLRKVIVPGYENVDVYKVVGVMEATPKNLSTFLRR